MANFPTGTNDKGASKDVSKGNKKNVLNTHVYNIPSKPEIDLGTKIRFGQGVAAFTIGKAKGALRFIGKDEYNAKKEGEKLQANWKKDGKSAAQIANDPSSNPEIPDHQRSRWFSGVKVIDSLTMSFPDFTTDKGISYVGQTINIQNVMMNVSQKKNIVKTAIAGAEGRVKQYISLDDYDIDFFGKIIGYDSGDGNGGSFVPGERPEIAIRNFVNFMNAPTAVEVGCDFLEVANITSGVIDSFKLTQEVGKLDNQTFKFRLLSDKPFEIIIEDL